MRKVEYIDLEIEPSILGPKHFESAAKSLFGPNTGTRWIDSSTIRIWPQRYTLADVESR